MAVSGGAESLIGRTVGNYVVLSKLGEGGMGTVYQAEHPGIGRRVAIKVLRAHLAGDPDTVARFFREARAVNQVRHPNVVQVLDLGTTPEGTIYAIMELLEGESLAGRLRRVRRLELGEATAVFDACADALEAVHAHGIVHRDLKPDNIFLARPDDGGPEVVKLLDFGVAKLLDGADANISQTGALIGTPAYMSPEQCEGQRDVDARTDVYAMGCVLYHMLVGLPPFQADSVTKMIMMQVGTMPPRAREHRPELPPAIEALLEQALAKRADERLQSMRAFRTALRGVARSAGVEIAMPRPSQRALEAVAPTQHAAAPAFQPTLPSQPGGGETLTTLGIGAGQQEAAEPPARRGRGRGGGLVLGLAGLGLVAAGVAAFVLLTRGDGSKTAGVEGSAGSGTGSSAGAGVVKVDVAVDAALGASAKVEPAARSKVNLDSCSGALAHVAGLMAGRAGAKTQPYRHLGRVASEPAYATTMQQGCMASFDDVLVTCFSAAASADDVVGCGDAFLGRRCAAGSQRECGSLAWNAIESGDDARAATLARAACAAGDGQGCSALGMLSYYGRGGAVDRAAAMANFARGMAVDDAHAYAYAGHFAELGIGAPPDLVEARRRFSAGCTLEPGHLACARLAALEDAGLGGGRDRKRAREHAERACEHDVPDGCRFLAAHARAKDAAALYARAAALYAERADVLPTHLLHLGELRVAGLGLPADPVAGLAEIGRACDQHEPLACRVLGQLHVGGGAFEIDVTRARAANQRACEAGLPDACAAATCQGLLDPRLGAPEARALAACKAAGHLGPVASKREPRVRNAPTSPRRPPPLRKNDDLAPLY
ncbi:MAG: protein kinase [Deltaproteobacteria bacterium]|nr:protein kinase [Deltaproteobacteria bacterium]